MNYNVQFASRAIKDLRNIPRKEQAKIIDKVERLGDEPYPTGS